MHEMKDRIKIATALGYYACATDPEAKTLSAAIKAYGLAEYANDIDCQVGFRKGFQEAEKHFAAKGQEAHVLRELVGWIARLEQAVVEQRHDIIEFLKRQEALTQHQAVYGGGGGARPSDLPPGKNWKPSGGESGGGGGGDSRLIAIDHDGMGGCVITEIGGGGGAPLEAVKAEMSAAPDDTIAIGVADIASKLLNMNFPSERDRRQYRWHSPTLSDLSRVGRWYMRKVGDGDIDLYCQMGKPVSFPDRPSCSIACADLKARMGFEYEPSYGDF